VGHRLKDKEEKMSVHGAAAAIKQAVLAWPGVTASPHRFGGTEFQLGSREIGHIHGDTLVDIPFPTSVRNELVSVGAAEPHHVLPDSGWISFYIRQPKQVAAAIILLRRSYELAMRQQQARTATPLSQADKVEPEGGGQA
jgi:hypothetical protein